MANNINISSVISPSILGTISTSAIIKTFGSQLKDKAKEKVISAVVNKTEQLRKQIEEVISLLIKVETDHSAEVKRLETLLKENQITQKQYDQAIEKENKAYLAKKKDLEALKLKLQQDLNNILNDPLRKIKENKNKRKVKQARRISRNKAQRTKAKRDLAKKVARNATKTLAPVIALQLTNQFISIISQRSQLEKLVDQVNAYIIQANTPETIVIATNLRNNTVALINNSIGKLERLQKIIQTLSVSLTIFTLLIPLLNRVAPLTVISTPPLTPIPGMIAYTELTNRKQRLERLVSALSVVLVVATVSLENEVIKLNELIERLREVNQLLNNNTLNNLNQQQLTELTSGIYSNVDNYPEYKGFKFKIKTEENKAFEVKGNKRRYAVAVDSDGVEVLKSEFSFTLDPQDLVDQLKLVIDQRNLQG